MFDIVIGNPPYGVAANMAIKFVNKAAEISDDVRMVLPASFQRDSVKNKINTDFALVEDINLPNSTFPRSITTVRQRWVRSDTPRELVHYAQDSP
jgi:predicted RNA methylase